MIKLNFLKKKTGSEQEPAARTGESQKPSAVIVSARPIPSQTVRSPLLTEKSTSLGAGRQYVFIVAREANKSEIKKEIERLFDLKVERVAIVNQKTKRKMWRLREGKRIGHKKAIVTIEEGKKIEILPT